MSDLSALIERLEAADKGSRELDDAIHTAIGGKDDPPAGALWRHTIYSLTAARFTDSLEVAMALIPERFYLDLHDWRWTENPRWHAHLQTARGEKYSDSSGGPTAALAVCRIAMRARQFLAEQSHEAGGRS